MTIQEFINKHQLEMSSVKILQNPHQPQWEADHYQIQVKQVGRGNQKDFTLFYSKGVGHKGKRPTLNEVLGCVLIDITTLDNSFEDWCANLGMGSDKISSLRTYEAQVYTAKSLRHFLGWDIFREFQSNVETE